MKQCFKCGVLKPLRDFYKHPAMADGHLNKCKECACEDTRQNRSLRIEQYRAYDRRRGNRQGRKYSKEYQRRYPRKYKAQTMVNNALRDGRLRKLPCEVCGATKRIHGHHDDYAYPLNIRWLCAAHHKQWHMENGEAPNGGK